MSDRVQIGCGYKPLHTVVILIFGLLTAVITLLCFVVVDAYIVAVAFLISFVFYVVYMRSFRFVYYMDGIISIEQLFGRETVVNIEDYEKCYITLFSIPLSNTLILEFSNGKKYRIMGGLQTIRNIDLMIRRLKEQHLLSQDASISKSPV